MKTSLTFIAILGIVVASSCKTGFKTQIYDFQPTIAPGIYSANEFSELLATSKKKSITLRNDSILEHFVRFGGSGKWMPIRYKVVNNEIIVDSIDIYGHIPEIAGEHFLYTRDSLIGTKPNNNYYNRKYLKKIAKKATIIDYSNGITIK